MLTLLTTNIRFPNLGIEFTNLGSGIDVFGFHIAYYGMIIGIG
ncbi:MAG: prolipoprotein diacylglyceryl transferase, partial [Clostridiales bacterium]|nr:prolipoprotein diacylglyceryl transferase [Clostridiales bacterium]